jgi:hypothetical protein
MRYIALLLLIFLASCDNSTSSEPVPAYPDLPQMTVTVLTGTKEAPVDSPSIKVSWRYADSVGVNLVTYRADTIVAPGELSVYSRYLTSTPSIVGKGVNSFVFKASCKDRDSARVMAIVRFWIPSQLSSGAASDSSKVIHCK